MIKPFKVVSTRQITPDLIGVTYRVWKVEWLSPGRSRKLEAEAYIELAADADVDQHLFNMLSNAGWF